MVDSSDEKIEAAILDIVYRTEDKIVQTYCKSIIESHAIFDKLSTWLLACTGLTLGLMISNMKSIIEIISIYAFRVSLYILTISAVLGLIQKLYNSHTHGFLIYVNLLLNASADIQYKLDEESTKLNIEYSEFEKIFNSKFDIIKVLDIAFQSIPFFYYKKTKKLLQVKDNRKIGSSVMTQRLLETAKAVFTQRLLTVCQFSFFLGFVLFITYCI
jgi:uncharacterized membrane-anchored protein YhcB (DUF1043 family)